MKFFDDNKKDIFPKFLFYTVLHYESYNSNPFRILEEKDAVEVDKNYLNKIISPKNKIYKIIISIPFSSTSDPSFFDFISNCQNIFTLKK